MVAKSCRQAKSNEVLYGGGRRNVDAGEECALREKGAEVSMLARGVPYAKRRRNVDAGEATFLLGKVLLVSVWTLRSIHIRTYCDA